MQGYRRTSEFAELTEKQREAMRLVCEGYTSKEAARVLSISPKMVDRRVDVVRQKFGGVARKEAARIFRADYMEGENLPRDQSPLTAPNVSGSPQSSRKGDEVFSFADAGAHSQFFETAPWENFETTSVPKFGLAQFGVAARLAMMGGGALLFAAVMLILIGVANGLEDLVYS